LARKTAADDARTKAEQYASLSRRRLGKVIKVIDQNRDQLIPFFLNSREFALQSQALKVPLGKVQVSASVEIHWKL
jgi:uncharacterized protein YggE